MKKNVLLEFINKHTSEIEKCRWVSNAKDKTLKVDVASDTRNLLCDITLANWDGFGDAEVGIGNLPKFKREFSCLSGEDVSFVLNYNDDKTRIINVDVMDGTDVGTFTVTDLDMIDKSSRLKSTPPYNAEIVCDADFIGRFLSATSALPDVKTFTVMMNKKGVLELIVGYSSINSSRVSLKVKTQDGKDKVDEPLYFRADYLKSIFAANSECESSVLKVSDGGLCSVSYVSGDFTCNYHLSTTEDQD